LRPFPGLKNGPFLSFNLTQIEPFLTRLIIQSTHLLPKPLVVNNSSRNC
jgi:hypothetical protein